MHYVICTQCREWRAGIKPQRLSGIKGRDTGNSPQSHLRAAVSDRRMWSWKDNTHSQQYKNLPIHRIQKQKKPPLSDFSLFSWCRRPDSNRHISRWLILNQLRLPISPLRHGRGFADSGCIIPAAPLHASIHTTALNQTPKKSTLCMFVSHLSGCS